MGIEGKKYSAPALEKGLDILELLSGEAEGLSLSEIARSLSRSVGEVFRMLVVLEQRGYVFLEPASGRYTVTTLLFELAHRLPVVRRLSLIATPVMHRLASAIRQSAHLGITTSNEVLVVAQVDSPTINVMAVRLGSKVNLWKTSSGRVIAAFLEAGELQRLLKEVPLPADTTKKEIESELAHIRESGFEVRGSFVVRGIVNISAPVLDHSGHAVAALTVPHIERFEAQISFEDCRLKVIEAAREISKALGAEANTLSELNQEQGPQPFVPST